MSENNFAKSSYKNHDMHFENYTKGAKKEERAKTWFNTNTVDSWRHKRMYTLIDPLLACYPEAKWLTVGDGRYGKDAHIILAGTSLTEAEIISIPYQKKKWKKSLWGLILRRLLLKALMIAMLKALNMRN